MRYVAGIDERGGEIDVRDPLAPRLRKISESTAGAPVQLVDGLLQVTEIFGDDLPRNQSFRALLVSQFTSLLERGALETVRDIARGR
jgi:fructuronate reductase